MAAIKVPEELKQDVPHNHWGKILVSTPVVMTVLATMLAGLASSEMTKAQYDRSYGAQLQSKAGDQWGFFQAKRLRGALQRATLDAVVLAQTAPLFSAGELLRAVEALPESEALKKDRQATLELLVSKEGRALLDSLENDTLPQVPASAALSAPVANVLEALDQDLPDEEVSRRLAGSTDAQLADDLAEARRQVRAFDLANKPLSQAQAKIEARLSRLKRGGLAPDAANAFVGARLRHEALRYDAEARLNQKVAALLELQVRKANVSAERHHRRSQRFFFGMLAAQAGAIASTFAIATQKRNLLWGLAAGAGFIAICLATYVYLFV